MTHRQCNARVKSWFVVILSGGLPSKRHALVILYILANLQKEDRPVLLLLLGETATIVRAASLDIKLEGDELPVLCVDATLSPLFAGGPSAEEFFKRVNPGDGRSRLDHIVYWDAEEGAYRLRLLSLESIVLDALVQYFKTWTAKPPKGIKAEGHFLLPTPSNAYCAIFWDINEVLGSKEKLAAAALGFAIYILRAKPNRVIALSFNAGRIAREALRWLGSDRDFRAQLQVVSDPHSQQSFLSVHSGALEGSWLVVTDVIGTTKVLTNALDMLGGKNISGVLAVVDAREPDSADFVRTGVGDVPLRSLLREPQVYYRDLPAGWFYPSIQTIDRILHRPISTHRPDLSPSLWGDDLAKTLMQCASCGALACGHFSSGTKHFSTFILTSRLIRRFVDDIVGAINMQLARAAESLPPGQSMKVSHAIYNEASADAGQVCAMLADANSPCRLVGVPAGIIRSKNISPEPLEEQVFDVVIVEPAASSGTTTRTLLTYAARMKPSRIFLFILADRMPEIEAWLLSNVNFVNGIRVEAHRFLSLSTSSFNLADCPQCTLKQEYEQVAGHIGNDLIAELAMQRFGGLGERPISDFRDPEASVISANKDLVWAEAAMQSRLHSAASDISIRHAVSELIGSDHNPAMHCCGVLLAVARELPLFETEAGPLREVLYPTFKERLLETSVQHLIDGTVAEEVRDAALVTLAEIVLSGTGALPSGFWKNCSEERIGLFVTEVARWTLRGPKQKGAAAAAVLLVQSLGEEAQRRGLLSPALAEALGAVRRLLRSSVDSTLTTVDSDKPSQAWEACASLFKRHGHVAAGIGMLLASIGPRRRTEELEEYYNRSWLDRVKKPLEEKLLPNLVRLQQCGLHKVHSLRWPLDARTLSVLSQRMRSTEKQFGKVLGPRDGFEESEFSVLIDELSGLKELLFGEDSAFLALLRRLVLRDVREISAHLRGVTDLLCSAGIESTLAAEDLPPLKGAFVSPADLLTCLDALVHNVTHHAFPAGYTGKRRAAIRVKVEANRYLVEIEDGGVGILADSAIPRSEGGLADVQAFAGAYGALFEVQSMSPGLRVSMRWELVDLLGMGTGGVAWA